MLNVNAIIFAMMFTTVSVYFVLFISSSLCDSICPKPICKRMYFIISSELFCLTYVLIRIDNSERCFITQLIS